MYTVLYVNVFAASCAWDASSVSGCLSSFLKTKLSQMNCTPVLEVIATIRSRHTTCSAYADRTMSHLSNVRRERCKQQEKEQECFISREKCNLNVPAEERPPLFQLNTMWTKRTARAQKARCVSIGIRTCRRWCGVWSQEAFGTVRCFAHRGKLRALISL